MLKFLNSQCLVECLFRKKMKTRKVQYEHSFGYFSINHSLIHQAKKKIDTNKPWAFYMDVKNKLVVRKEHILCKIQYKNTFRFVNHSSCIRFSFWRNLWKINKYERKQQQHLAFSSFFFRMFYNQFEIIIYTLNKKNSYFYVYKRYFYDRFILLLYHFCFGFEIDNNRYRYFIFKALSFLHSTTWVTNGTSYWKKILLFDFLQ